jgi:predicted RNase H-like nuclease
MNGPRMAGAVYLGVDLAWSERSGSGVCALDSNGSVLDEDQIMPAELPDWIRRWRGDRSVLALDGPLVVPQDGRAMREVERELHRRFGRYHAGPYPGGAGALAMRGKDRSTAAALVDVVGDYVVDPTDRAAPHRAIEAFPAPSWITLFGLSTSITYKRGRKARRIDGLGRVRVLVDGLASAEPPLVGPTAGTLAARVEVAKTIRDWKAIEDIIDARLCAYIAMAWDRRGTDDWIVTGNGTWETGYIIVPDRVNVVMHGEDTRPATAQDADRDR